MTSASSHTAPTRSLAQWLEYLEQIHPTTIDMGLERIQCVADRLQLDFSNTTVITVGGTNGKGTTCRLLEKIALSRGESVAVYSSPHLLDYRERVRYNDCLPAESLFCEAFAVVEDARQEISLTYFEFGTLAALVMANEWQPDVLLLEVGLGGRLDATNIIDSDCAVITSIGLDHQDWLGNTREAIATEKAGIMRANKPVIIGEPEPPTTLRDAASKLNCESFWVGQDFSLHNHEHGLLWQSGNVCYGPLNEPHIPIQNLATALMVAEHLGWLSDTDALNRVIDETLLPGRRQTLQHNPKVVVDVAHNPQATAALCEWLKGIERENLYIVVGMLSDKDSRASLGAFDGLTAYWRVGTTKGPRGLGSEQLASYLPKSNDTQCYADVVCAYRAALEQAGQNDLILVFGSFLTVADVLALHTGQTIS